MSQTYTVRLGTALVAAAGSEELVAVGQPGFTTVIRSVSLINFAASTNLTSLLIRTGSEALNVFRVRLAPESSTLLDLRQVLLPGEEFRLYAELEPVQVLITGYQLDAA